jgi:hypothetical protein
MFFNHYIPDRGMLVNKLMLLFFRNQFVYAFLDFIVLALWILAFPGYGLIQVHLFGEKDGHGREKVGVGSAFGHFVSACGAFVFHSFISPSSY